MQKIDPKLLDSILRIQTYSHRTKEMRDFIKSFLRANKIPHSEDSAGNIYAGNFKRARPLIVSHTDTVHRIHTGQSLVPVQINNRITGMLYPSMEQSGIGGDDKVGIYMGLHLLLTGLVNAAFFVDEEVGCLGSTAADMRYFKKTTFALQADRQRKHDFVTDIGGAISSPEFQADVTPYLEKYSYKFSTGLMTDVEALADNGIGISLANMSCGYYNPHSDTEYIDLDDMENTLNLMFDLISYLGKTRYPHKRERSYYSNWGDSYKWDGWVYDEVKKRWNYNPSKKQTNAQTNAIPTRSKEERDKLRAILEDKTGWKMDKMTEAEIDEELDTWGEDYIKDWLGVL